MMPLELAETSSGSGVAVAPEDPAHADQLAEPHQRPGGHLRIERRRSRRPPTASRSAST